MIKKITFAKLDLFLSSGEWVGGIFFLGCIRKNLSQSLDLFLTDPIA
jgi:hypothetical protein